MKYKGSKRSLEICDFVGPGLKPILSYISTYCGWLNWPNVSHEYHSGDTNSTPPIFKCSHILISILVIHIQKIQTWAVTTIIVTDIQVRSWATSRIIFIEYCKCYDKRRLGQCRMASKFSNYGGWSNWTENTVNYFPTSLRSQILIVTRWIFLPNAQFASFVLGSTFCDEWKK